MIIVTWPAHPGAGMARPSQKAGSGQGPHTNVAWALRGSMAASLATAYAKGTLAGWGQEVRIAL